MSRTKNKYSVARVTFTKIHPKTGTKRTIVAGYLSQRDEEQGLDIQLDLKGFTIEAL